MSAQSDPRRRDAIGAESKYYYRRRLTARELLPALGAGIGAGLVVFYIAKLFIERTALQLESNGGDAPRLTLHRSTSLRTARNVGRR